MIDITNFAIEYQGIWLEISGTSAPNQCVDLANVYIRNFLKLPMIEWTNAVDFPSKAGTNYTWIVNTLTNIPEEGNLIVWNGIWGHIAIFMDGNVNDFHSLDQNYPTGTNTHLQYHDYTNVKGWLQCKNSPVPAEVMGLNSQIIGLTESLKQANEKVQKIKTFVSTV